MNDAQRLYKALAKIIKLQEELKELKQYKKLCKILEADLKMFKKAHDWTASREDKRNATLQAYRRQARQQYDNYSTKFRSFQQEEEMMVRDWMKATEENSFQC